jgi:hypothetical protein
MGFLIVIIFPFLYFFYCWWVQTHFSPFMWMFEMNEWIFIFESWLCTHQLIRTAGSRYSVVGVVSCWWVDSPEFKSWHLQEIFSSPKLSRPPLGPTRLLCSEYRDFFLGYSTQVVKLTTPSPEVKNEWSYISAPPKCQLLTPCFLQDMHPLP